MKRFAAAVVLVVGFAVPAVAQVETVVQEAPREIVKKNTTINFGGAGIDGTVDRPAITTIAGDYKPSFKNLIQLRVSFSTELNRSVDNL